MIEGKGIRVFSRPEALEEWLGTHDLTLDDRRNLITDAGQVIPEFTRKSDGVEFFVHCPFATKQDDDTVVDRNGNSLVLHATFEEGGVTTKILLTSDLDHEVLSDIVRITRLNANEDYIKWEIFKIPHHCSYKSIGPEKGKDTTKPEPNVEWLLESQGEPGGILISSSKPIPTDGKDDQPPHTQAANYYRKVAKQKSGQFKVTMEYPSTKAPEPLVIVIDDTKARIKDPVIGGAAALIHSSPRAGWF